MIIKCHQEFRNINIFLERGIFEYETAGRLQTEQESREIDTILKHMFRQKEINYTSFESSLDDDNMKKIIDFIVMQTPHSPKNA